MSTPSLGRASLLGGVGTVASRLTGFVRTIVVADIIGTRAFGNAYTVANTTPNVVYDLLLGGVLSSVVVPLLVRAHREDPDGGTAFSQALLTAVVVVLGVVTVLGVLAAPLLMDLYLPVGGAVTAVEHARAVTFTRWFLPQLLFYALTATAGAVLNTRGRFGRDTLVPVLNNVVVTATAVVFLLLPGPRPPAPATVTAAQMLVLSVGTTLGVVVMALALLPSLRAAGVPWRWRRLASVPGGSGTSRLADAGRLAGWVAVAVVVSQLGFLVVTRLAGGQDGAAVYATAYQLFQLPYAVAGVSVLSALMPRMSRSAAAGRPDLVRRDLDAGLRLALTLVVPCALGLAVLAVPLSVTLFHGASGGSSAVHIGQVLAILALGLVPFTVQQLVVRAFYALSDSRTAALLTALTTGVLVALDLAIAASVSGSGRVLGLAVGFTTSYTLAAAASTVVLRRRLGGTGARVVRLTVRIAVAAALGAGIAWVCAEAVLRVWAGFAGSAVALLLSALVGGAAYLRAARRMRVSELDGLLAGVGRLLNRR